MGGVSRLVIEVIAYTAMVSAIIGTAIMVGWWMVEIIMEWVGVWL